MMAHIMTPCAIKKILGKRNFVHQEGKMLIKF